MNNVGKWFNSAGPLAKTVMALSITTLVLVTNKLVYAPYAKRKRYRQAEEWANTILDEEEMKENSGSPNIS